MGRGVRSDELNSSSDGIRLRKVAHLVVLSALMRQRVTPPRAELAGGTTSVDEQSGLFQDAGDVGDEAAHAVAVDDAVIE